MTNTTKPTIKIHDVETGEIVEREMNDLEFTQYEKDQKDKAKMQLDAQEKAAAKVALLKKLGITESEAELLNA
jgi:hypothetical protein